MRRLLLPIAVLIAALAVPAGAGAYTLGVSDQQAGTFTNPDFAALKFKAARYITPYDVMESPADKAQLDAWLTAARAAHQKILVSFEHSHRSNSRALKAPSVAAYTKELKKFKKAYPFVRDISPWNEVNRCHALRDGSVQGQPTKICSLTTGPKATAQYYMAARKVFTGSKYRIVGLDILDEQNVNKTIGNLGLSAAEEDQLVAFSQTWGHFWDIGGMRAGSISPDATEIFHEGIIVPAVRIYREGVLNDEAFRIFIRNSRFPEILKGDIRAVLAGCQLGERRVLELFERFGAETVLAADEPWSTFFRPR